MWENTSVPSIQRLWASADRVVCTITDCGTGFADPLAGFLGDVPPDRPDLLHRLLLQRDDETVLYELGRPGLAVADVAGYAFVGG